MQEDINLLKGNGIQEDSSVDVVDISSVPKDVPILSMKFARDSKMKNGI